MSKHFEFPSEQFANNQKMFKGTIIKYIWLSASKDKMDMYSKHGQLTYGGHFPVRFI